MTATQEQVEAFESNPFLHIRGQYNWHDHVQIVGNRPALIALQKAIDTALAADGATRGFAEAFVTDGEGYFVQVDLMPTHAEMKAIPEPYTDDVARDNTDRQWPLESYPDTAIDRAIAASKEGSGG